MGVFKLYGTERFFPVPVRMISAAVLGSFRCGFISLAHLGFGTDFNSGLTQGEALSPVGTRHVMTCWWQKIMASRYCDEMGR